MNKQQRAKAHREGEATMPVELLERSNGMVPMASHGIYSCFVYELCKKTKNFTIGDPMGAISFEWATQCQFELDEAEWDAHVSALVEAGLLKAGEVLGTFGIAKEWHPDNAVGTESGC